MMTLSWRRTFTMIIEPISNIKMTNDEKITKRLNGYAYLYLLLLVLPLLGLMVSNASWPHALFFIIWPIASVLYLLIYRLMAYAIANENVRLLALSARGGGSLPGLLRDLARFIAVVAIAMYMVDIFSV